MARHKPSFGRPERHVSVQGRETGPQEEAKVDPDTGREYFVNKQSRRSFWTLAEAVQDGAYAVSDKTTSAVPGSESPASRKSASPSKTTPLKTAVTNGRAVAKQGYCLRRGPGGDNDWKRR